MVFSYHSNFLYEKNKLLELTKKQGKKNYRKDPKLNIDLDIVVMLFSIPLDYVSIIKIIQKIEN